MAGNQVVAAAQPNAPTCFTCDIIDEYVNLANQFTQDLSAALLSPMWILFMAIVGVWVAIRGLRMMMAWESPNNLPLAEFAKELAYVIIAAFLLSGQGPEMVNSIYIAALKMMGGAASVALQMGDKAPLAIPANTIGGGMHELVFAAEDGVRDVFSMADSISSQGSLTSPMPFVYAGVLIIPYFLVLVVYFSQVVVSIFRIMMLATMSPFLMLGYGFGWGRGMAMDAFKTLLSAFMVLFGATAALSVMLYAVRTLEIAAIPTGGITDLWADGLSPEYIVAVAMGWMGTAFMTEATGMANSIAGSSLTNTATGVITAGAATSAYALGKGTGALAKKGLGHKDSIVGVGGQLAGKGASAAAYGVGAAIGGSIHMAQKVAELVAKAKKEG